MKRFLTAIFLISLASVSFAQIDARMFRYPDVSSDKITFCYAGDIWIAPKSGGVAQKLSSPKGDESFPKFSPDGESIAFSGNYAGNEDVYILPVTGGLPSRVTYHPHSDRMLDWVDGGKSVLFASARNSGRQRFRQLYTISSQSGLAEKLPVPYGEFGTISEDGEWLAYTKNTRLFRTWKRYRGGTASDIWLFNLKNYEWKNITENDANDEMPMWHGNKIYYLSDMGPAKRFNIWVYDTENGSNKQITFFDEYDIHFPSIGPKDIVFEAGGELYLLNIEKETYSKVKIEIIADQLTLIPQIKNVSKNIAGASISPDGKRVIFEARGELFSVPKKDGVVYDLTQSCGAAERFPAWSPDGKSVAYWSDKSGEYELTVKDLSNPAEEKKLTSTGEKFKYNLFWSPNSKMIAFIDNAMNVRIFNIETEKFTEVDKARYKYHGALQGFRVSWSSDSKYLTYSRGVDNSHNAIFIFDVDKNKTHQVTSGFYSDSQPEFDADGKYLFFITDRTFSPVYSDLDNTFIYPNSSNIAAAPLTAEIASPLAPKNDEVEIKKEEKEDEDPEKKDDEEKKDEKKESNIKIDFNNFENRVVLLPAPAGNYYNLQSVKGKVVYQQSPNSGSAEKNRPIKFYDLKEREEKTVLKNAGSFEISADGKQMLVSNKNSFYIIGIKADQKLKDALPTSKLEMKIDPKKEWKQIYTDAWRLMRDYFYDPNMHGVDWDKVRAQYGKLVEFAVTRSDLNYLLGEMIGELNASHTYKYGGDAEYGKREGVGLLGINWELEDGYYKIKQIIKDAPWDCESRSPLSLPGVKIKEGDFILAVNGKKLDAGKEPFAAFEGLAGQTVELTINDKPSFDDAKKIFVETMRSESRLRHLSWMEQNREYVDKASNGDIGYIYVRSTGTDGQSELIRQFVAQIDKKALIVDERFNSGGQIPDRFIEMLNRKPLAFWGVRDGSIWQSPPTANFGPKVMLINGWSGSGGDAFPDYFRKAGLGKLIGMRTWGGLIGYTGVPSLIDGGGITVPTFRMYDPDGKWFKEGHGVDPDIEVIDNPSDLANGIDPQLKKAVEVLKDELNNNPFVRPERPPYEKR